MRETPVVHSGAGPADTAASPTSARCDRPDHIAVPYTDADDLAARLAPRLREAIEAGAPVVAVLAEAERAALRERLGKAVEHVEFPDPTRVHAVPAFTVAIRWARLARRAGRGRAVVVCQHLDDLPVREPDHWARLDIALNVAVEGVAVTVLCPCRGDGADTRANHPLLLTADGPRPSPGYRAPPEAVVDYPPPPPPDLGPPTDRLPFTRTDLVELRRRVAAAAVAAGMDEDRVSDVVLAVNELASNSLEHGPGCGRLRIWADGATLTCEIADDGRMEVRFPGLVAPAPSGVRGRGLWLASELTDVLQVWNDDSGTVIRVSCEIPGPP